MNQYKPSPSLGRPSIPSGEDPMMDFRARLVHQQAEAAERRAKRQSQEAPAAKEVGGPSGPEPTRYGDWEKKGLTSDF